MLTLHFKFMANIAVTAVSTIKQQGKIELLNCRFFYFFPHTNLFPSRVKPTLPEGATPHYFTLNSTYENTFYFNSGAAADCNN